jgi:hypothetical protein
LFAFDLHLSTKSTLSQIPDSKKLLLPEVCLFDKPGRAKGKEGGMAAFEVQKPGGTRENYHTLLSAEKKRFSTTSEVTPLEFSGDATATATKKCFCRWSRCGGGEMLPARPPPRLQRISDVTECQFD